ncbi:MAG: cache domain-containing protein [Methylocystaceae bacterium]|nr:cache domain-containing protein [Methylocystaceae bacterium]
MLQKASKFLFALLCITFLSVNAQATDRATPDEAKQLCEKAAAFLKENGIEASKAAFHAPGAPWHDRDLYVFVFNPEGITLIHGAKDALVGRDLTKLRDVDGKLFLKEIVSVQDKGWVDYKWQNPVTNKVEAKTSYVINTGDYVVGVGAYK